MRSSSHRSVYSLLHTTETTEWTTGSAAANIFVGTSGDDSIHGGVGDDEIFGESGNDVLYGGAGRNTVDGGAGDDNIYTGYGGPGRNTVDGGGGDDNIYTGSGIDLVFGGAGDDDIYGSRSHDTINGGTGDDYVEGGPDAEHIFGGPGDDYLSGGAGADLIVGGKGDDTINWGEAGLGHQGRDTVYGGAGDDKFYATLGGALIFGGNGKDYIWVDDKDGATIHGGNGNDTIELVSPLNSHEFVYGGRGNDTFLLEGGGRLMLSGGAGNDTFAGYLAGKGTIDGGTGYDTLYTDEYNPDFKITGIERLLVGHTTTLNALADCWTTTSPYDDTIIESSKPGSRETLEGGAGHDTLVGRLDADGAVTFMVAAETAADVDTIQGFDRSAGDQLALHGIAALGVVDRLSTDTTAVAPDTLVYQTDTGDLLFNGQLLAHIQAAGANFGGALQWSDFIFS